MSEIEGFYGGRGGLVGRDGRRTVRAVSGHRSNACSRTAAVDAEVDVAMAKVEGASLATGAGMTAVTRLAIAQRNLETMAPEAAGRLNLLADDHAIGTAETLQLLRYKLRRI